MFAEVKDTQGPSTGSGSISQMEVKAGALPRLPDATPSACQWPLLPFRVPPATPAGSLLLVQLLPQGFCACCSPYMESSYLCTVCCPVSFTFLFKCHLCGEMSLVVSPVPSSLLLYLVLCFSGGTQAGHCVITMLASVCESVCMCVYVCTGVHTCVHRCTRVCACVCR